MMTSQESSDVTVVPDLALGCSISVFTERAAQSASLGSDSAHRGQKGHRWQIPQSLLVRVSAGKLLLRKRAAGSDPCASVRLNPQLELHLLHSIGFTFA